MKIALFSDIHANLPALHAFFNSMDTQKPDALYCLGDLVGYHIWPNEVINYIRRRGIATIAGNHDAKVGHLSEAERTAPSGKNYAYSLIGADERTYLASMPAHIRVEFQLHSEKLTLLLVHGSPASNDEYLLQDKPETEFLSVLGLLRFVYHTKNKEATTWVIFEGVFFSEMIALKSGLRTTMSLEAIEPSTVLTIDKNALNSLCAEVRPFETFLRLTLEENLYHLLQMKLLQQFSTAKERYELLIKDQRLSQRIPQQYLASIMGITPYSFSRLRALQKH